MTCRPNDIIMVGDTRISIGEIEKRETVLTFESDQQVTHIRGDSTRMIQRMRTACAIIVMRNSRPIENVY